MQASEFNCKEVPAPTPFRPPLFNIENDESTSRALEFLKEEGYVVFEDVISKDEIKAALEDLWDFLEGMDTGIKRDDPSTWSTENWPPGVDTGVIYTHYIGQSKFLWNLRAKPLIAKIYSKIWNAPVSDLLTSFDGCGVMRPTNYDSSWATKGSWYHLDQNGFKKPSDCCYQGLLNLIETMEEEPGLVALPKSIHKFNSFFDLMDKEKMKDGPDFVFVQPEHLLGHFKGLQPVKMCVPAGAFLVWSGRTVHCNSPRLVPRPEIPRDRVEERKAVTLERAVAYICMSPRSAVECPLNDLLEKKQRAIKEGATTNHWPNEFVPARTYRGASTYKPYIEPKLTEYQQRLGGLC